MSNKHEPLVSVTVLVYNSSKTVIETLDSIKAQTYQNIELIISDDCSNDNSVAICKEWLSDNEKRFTKVHLLTVPKNTGTVKSANRAAKVASGEWLKDIAADDRLLPNCIRDDVDFINDYPETDFLFTKVCVFGSIVDKKKWHLVEDCSLLFEKMSERQRKILMYQKDYLPAPSCFKKSSSLKKLGGYDESFLLIEDWPLWMKAYMFGCVIRFMPKETVEYRIHDSSVSQDNKNESFKKDLFSAQKRGLDYLKEMNPFSFIYVNTLNYMNSKPSVVSRGVHRLNLFNPFYWENKNVLKKYFKILDLEDCSNK